jgi:hypothetical protein
MIKKEQFVLSGKAERGPPIYLFARDSRIVFARKVILPLVGNEKNGLHIFYLKKQRSQQKL